MDHYTIDRDPSHVRQCRALSLMTWAVRTGRADEVRRALAVIRAMRALDEARVRKGGAA